MATVGSKDICSGGLDELSNLRGELFAFKGRMLWRFSSRGVLRDGYPAEFGRMFGDFGGGVEHVDAAYERRDGNIVFFSGELLRWMA